MIALLHHGLLTILALVKAKESKLLIPRDICRYLCFYPWAWFLGPQLEIWNFRMDGYWVSLIRHIYPSEQWSKIRMRITRWFEGRRIDWQIVSIERIVCISSHRIASHRMVWYGTAWHGMAGAHSSTCSELKIIWHWGNQSSKTIYTHKSNRRYHLPPELRLVGGRSHHHHQLPSWWANPGSSDSL